MKSHLRSLLVGLLLLAFTGVSFGAESPKDQVKTLVAVLNSGASQKEKADACRELSRIATPETVKTLAGMLGDEKLSHMARYAMETIPDSAVDKAFRKALDQLHGKPLVGVIGSVGVRRDAKAVKRLAELLRDPDTEVAAAAARALGSIGGSASAKALLSEVTRVAANNQLSVCEGLFRCAEKFSKAGDNKQAIQIYDALRKVSGPHQVRAGAFRGAVLARQEKGMPLLTQAIRGEDPILFAAALRVGQEMPGDEVTKTLVALVDQLPPERQTQVLDTLAKRGDPGALPVVYSSLKSPDKSVRLMAIRGFGELGDPTAAPTLIDLLKDSDTEISAAALGTLAALPGKTVDAAITSMLNNAEIRSRLTGLDLIVRRRMTQSLPTVLSLAKDGPVEVRTAAIKKVGELGSSAEVLSLLDLLLNAKDAEAASAAEQALSTLCANLAKPEACAAAINTKFATATTEQKAALIRVLSTAGGPTALTAVRAAVKDPDKGVRSAAVRALSNWNTVEVAPDLLQLSRDSSDATEKLVSLRSYLKLAGEGEVPSKERFQMCCEAKALVEKPEEKKLLISALGKIESVDALSLIQPYLEDETVREEAISASLTLAEKLIQSKDAASFASKLVEPLGKVAEIAAARPESAAKARDLQEKAKAKAK